MLAELALTGESVGDAVTHFEDALNAAIDHVHEVSKRNGLADDQLISEEEREEFIDAILAKFNAANAEGKMRILMTQKWIHNFMNPVDVYTDHRRTGYPLWFDPAKTQDSGYGVNPIPTENSDARVPLATFNTFPRSLYYPTNSEIELNANMDQKTNITVPLVFWDK